MPEHVTILGDGAMATVCSMLLTQGGHAVTMWGAFEESIERLQQNREQARLLPGARIPPAVRLTANDADCFRGCTMILSAVPTQYMRSVWKRLRAHVPKGVPIVSVAKGIENDSLLRPTQVIADVLGGIRLSSVGSASADGILLPAKIASAKPDPTGSGETRAQSLDLSPAPSGPECDWPLAALSGPNIAAEMAKYLPATAVAAAADEAIAVRVQETFSTQWFRVYTNRDAIGVELAGATKNVIAIAAGILDGLAAGNNAKAALVTRGLVEITRLGMAMGAEEATFQGLAGLGDLITTCVSPEGRNRTVGEQIGRGKKLADILAHMDSVAEGVPTTKAVVELARRFKVEMPITQAVHEVLFDGKDVIHALTDLMTRDPKPEREPA